MAEEAIRTAHVAVENDTEVYVARIEQIEGSLNQTAKHYSQLLASSDALEAHSEENAAARAELEDVLKQIDSVEQSVDHLDVIAEELEQYSLELVRKS